MNLMIFLWAWLKLYKKQHEGLWDWDWDCWIWQLEIEEMKHIRYSMFCEIMRFKYGFL